jgi:hypothetical protein
MNGQLNVTPIADKQPQPSCEFTIQAVLRGFPIEIKGTGRAADLALIVERLLQSGAEPPAKLESQAATPKAAGAPTCPVHGSKMKEGRRGYFCPKKVGDGYCKETA